EVTHKTGILSYRVLYFEKDKSGAFNPPEDYPEQSLASISTHDLATLAGWWEGTDIRLRAETGRQSESDTGAALQQRQLDRVALLQALEEAGLLSKEFVPALTDPKELPERLGEELFVAIHRFAARASSVLFAVQLDDMLMSVQQANLPGTIDEYPNWRIRTPVTLEELSAQAMFSKLAQALAEERPRA
ncbi:MAG: 4-alpha-glucanotransferase, partial [Verrucomicrobiaceae bacterium]